MITITTSSSISVKAFLMAGLLSGDPVSPVGLSAATIAGHGWGFYDSRGGDIHPFCIHEMAGPNANPRSVGMGGISGSVIAPHIRKVPFDTKKDFDFVLQFADYFQGIAVKADAPWNTLKEYLEYARKNPGKATYATAGANSGQFLTMEIIAKQAGVKLKHIPYKGGTPAVAACLGGHVQGVAAAEIPEQAKAGKMKILAIFGEQKAEAFKDVPTLKELGYKVQLTFWLGIVGPKGIAPERLEILQNAFKKAMEAKSFHKLLQRFEMTPTYKSGKDFKAMVFNHYDAMKEVIEDMGMARK